MVSLYAVKNFFKVTKVVFQDNLLDLSSLFETKPSNILLPLPLFVKEP